MEHKPTQDSSSLAQSGHAHRGVRLLRQPRMLTPLVLLMGFVGASLRYALEVVLPSNGGFPYATLIVNIIGCFLLEIINQFVGRRLHLPMPVVKSLGLGLVGAFTTLSALSTEGLSFLQAGAYGMFALYFALTITTTFVASLAGRATSRALALWRVQRKRTRRREGRDTQ